MSDAVLPAIEIETRRPAQASVIWLHGLGADGHDFAGIVPELRLPETLAVRFVFPHAPQRPVTINGGYVMRAWYDIASLELSSGQDAAGIRASAAALHGLIARERERGMPAGRIVLGGFSQGGAIALHTGLRYPERLAGIMALSAYLPLADSVAAEAHAANARMPIFMAHGTVDTVVAPAYAQASCRRLQELGYAVSWREYPMAHAVCLPELADIRAWLTECLTAPCGHENGAAGDIPAAP